MLSLGFMRRHRKWLYGFLWLVIGAFIILYIPAFQGAGEKGPGASIVDVGSLPITVGEYQKAYARQREMYQSLYQGKLDNEALKRLGLEEQTLQGLIEERLILLEAQRLGILVSDEALRERLTSAPEYQVDGRFVGADELRRRLDMQGMSVSEFEEGLRSRIVRERLSALVTDGVVVTPREAEEEYRNRTEQVKAEYVLVPADPGAAPAAEAEVRARFEKDKEAYRLPERRVISFLLLDAAALQSRVTVTEAEERGYYDAHTDEFKQPEQVCASHFLVKVKSSAEAPEGHPDDEAKAIAQKALDEVKGGADFAAVAKKVSEDQGSAPRGGDLGCFPRGRMVTEFENAAFSLDAGQTSSLVKTPYGYHVIRVISRREETTPALAQVKDRIHQVLVGQKVRSLMEEKVSGIADMLRRGKSLEDAAKAQGATVSRSAPFTRAEPLSALPSPELAARAFEMKKGETEPRPFFLRRVTCSSPSPRSSRRVPPPSRRSKAKVEPDLQEREGAAGGRRARRRPRAARGEGRAREGRGGSRPRAEGDPRAGGPRAAPGRSRRFGRAGGRRLHPAREDALRPRARPGRRGRDPRAREEALRSRGLRQGEGPAPGLAARAAEAAALPGLHGGGAAALPDPAPRRHLPPRDGRAERCTSRCGRPATS